MTKEKTYPINTFSERIDAVLFMMNIKKVRFYADLELSKQTVTQWKKGSMPAADKLLKISDYLDVHPKWLLYGKINDKQIYDIDSAKSQVTRIYNTLKEDFNCFPDQPNFLMPLQNCVTEVQLSKWALGMQIPTINQLKEIAEKLGTSILYIINGTDVAKEQSRFETTSIQTYYCLDEKNQKAVDETIIAFYAKQLYDREHKQDPDKYLTESDPYDDKSSTFEAGLD